MQRKSPVHRLEIGPAADADRAETHAAAPQQQRIEPDPWPRQTRSYQANVSAGGERFDGIGQRARSADLDDAVGASAAGKFEDFLVPIRRLDIIDHPRGAERLEAIGLVRGRGNRDYLSAKQPRKLQREN